MAAGRFIQGVDRSSLKARYKAAGSSAASQLVTEVDLRSETIIREHLAASCKQWNIAFVGEESVSTVGTARGDRLAQPCFWCVDPLDGTLPFVEGAAGYAVSIALVAQSGEPLIGVVFDPEDNSLVQAVKGRGVSRTLSQDNSENEKAEYFCVYADASFRLPSERADIAFAIDNCARSAGLPGAEIVYGSGAVKNAWQVWDSPAACYLKLPSTQEGGGSIWDFAATACIAREAGAWASDAYGNALDLNRTDSTFMNHRGVLFASNQRIASILLDAISL